jgi:S-DNA-T family DNA segregation ATPase FtsK/SpoIIIE
MATRRRTASRSPSRRAPSRRRRGVGLPSLGGGWALSPEVVRSLVGVSLLSFGAVTLIALALPGEGTLTTWWRNVFAPWFGTGRWALPFALLAAGVYVERARGTGGGWRLTLFGAGLAFVAGLGLLELLGLPNPFRDGEALTGGRIGAGLVALTGVLFGRAGAFVVLAAGFVAGLLIMLDMGLRSLVAPVGRLARAVTTALASQPTDDAPASNGRPAVERGTAARPQAGSVPRRSGSGSLRERVGRRARALLGQSNAPGGGSLWGGVGEGELGGPSAAGRSTGSAVEPLPSPGFAAAGGLGAPRPAAPVEEQPGGVATATTAPSTSLGDAARPAAGAASPTTDAPDAYRLPELTMLDDVASRTAGPGMDHARNAAIIESKLASFNIAARVVRWNAGPVVTQYEVEPDPSVKVSRIESLADDLAMALAARTIRIEAPIPGKSVVGIEIPNSDFNIVSLRRVLEEVDIAHTSKLTFALGRDVAGHARAADLAKMPHLLIAGATGSGKSVMVNALISSILMHATPDEVRFILVDLKRVELAAYNELPHLLVPVITEPDKAKAALRWAVGEMERRYRRFAGAGARNITAFNESRVDPADRVPFIVVVIDELADLMIREGKNVEDPIVRLAQKARATGIHLVLATQRPSVNVVTGLIKANFPSRIAFAMASQIDSRTILDAPGAEDLIGRGDMLFQPADAPRPMRLQGVFVSDREIRNITEYWRSWPHRYDLDVIASEDGDEDAQTPLDGDADRLLPEVIAVIREYDRASTSFLQRRFGLGYARAARIMDQLEARGYVGPPDGASGRQVLRRDEPLPRRTPVDDEDEREA